MEHLSLEIFDIGGTGSKYAHLPEDVSITITDTSEVFASGDVWSYSFTLNTEANVHIFGSAGEMHGARLHEQINNRRARLWVDGEAMYLGYLKLADEVDVDDKGNVDVTFESGQKTFEQLIEGAKANQVPLMGDVMYGVALWRKRWTRQRLQLTASLAFKGGATTYSGEVVSSAGVESIPFITDGEDDNTAIQEYPCMVFPKGEFKNLDTGSTEEMNFLNTDYPYDDEHPYCNVALCYQKSGYQRKDTAGNVTVDYDSDPEPQRGYEVMPANRVNSAPNFFVIYWIRCLMKHLGIHIDENQMMDVTDLRRLFFVNTKCAYREPKHIRNSPYTEGFGRYTFSGERLIPEHFRYGENGDFAMTSMVNTEESGFVADIDSIITSHQPSSDYPPCKLIVGIDKITSWTAEDQAEYERKNSYLHDAYATPECFPNAEISETLEALENAFGVRLLFSDNFKRVRIVLLRNIFRSDDVQDIACEVVSNTKQENCIRGFRMTYGESTDTAFYYKGFADMLPHQKVLWPDDSDDHDYSKWSLDEKYENILHKVSAFNNVCYVTPVNGNAYGIKVDKDAKRYNELFPSLFEYAGYMDAEDGDCTGEDNTIEEISMGFKPAIMNDINWEKERSGGEKKQLFALFVDESMRPRRPDLKEDNTDYNDADAYYDVDGKLYAKDEDGKYVYVDMMGGDSVVKPGEFHVMSDMFGQAYNLECLCMTKPPLSQGGSIIIPQGTFRVKFDIDGHINEGFRLYLQDNFETTDTGESPVGTHDWGLTLGIMRGSGDDAGVKYEDDPDDWEGNDAWEIEPGSSVTTHPDMCDNYGNEWDYNGQQEDIGMKEGRISLKLRAEKPNPKFNPDMPESDDNRRYLEITTERLKGRGLCDQFYKEYSYWVRNARIAKIQARMELAQLQTIDKTKRVRVGDIYGFIRKIQYTVSQKTGLGMVTMEIMYL